MKVRNNYAIITGESDNLIYIDLGVDGFESYIQFTTNIADYLAGHCIITIQGFDFVQARVKVMFDGVDWVMETLTVEGLAVTLSPRAVDKISPEVRIEGNFLKVFCDEFQSDTFIRRLKGVVGS